MAKAGGGTPLVQWMLGLDASGALDSIKEFETQTKDAQDKFTERAKAMFPTGSVSGISKALKSTLGEATRDVLAMGKTADAVFAKMGQSLDHITFGSLKSELRDVQRLLKDGAISAEIAGAAMDRIHDRQAARGGAGRTLATMGGVGLAGGVIGTRSLISQGMSTSGQGAMAAFQNEQLSRQVAGLFAPITEENTQRVAQLTNYFRSLTGAQQESIRTMGMFVSTTGALLYVLPKASSSLATFMGASAGMSKAFGIGGMVASAGIGLLASTPEGRDALTEVAKAFEPVVEGLMHVVNEFRPAIADFAVLVKDSAGLYKSLADILKSKVGGDTVGNWAWSTTGPGIYANVRKLMGFDSPTPARSELSPRANGFEMPVDTWERLNASAQNIELAQQTATNTAATAAAVTNQTEVLMRWLGILVPGIGVAQMMPNAPPVID